MVINSTAASSVPSTLHKWCAVKIGTHIVHHSYCTIFLLKKEKKGERWNGSCSGKKPAVTLWIYEICDDQHGF